MTTPPRARIVLQSFGFKYGLPAANYYFDVGFATNPARQPQWTFFSDVDEEMVKFVLAHEPVSRFLDLVVPLIEHLATIDSHHVIALGCSAGRHRSPILVHELARRLEPEIPITLRHRELGADERSHYQRAVEAAHRE